MSINKRHGTVVFHCDICGVRRFDPRRIPANIFEGQGRRVALEQATRQVGNPLPGLCIRFNQLASVKSGFSN